MSLHGRPGFEDSILTGHGEVPCEFGTCYGGDTPQHHTVTCYLGEDTENDNG